MSLTALSLLPLFACSDYQYYAMELEAYPAEDSAAPAWDSAAPEPEEEEEPAPQQEEEAPAEPEEDEDCVESSTAFDIEEVSALQDAFGLPQVRDGLTLSVDSYHVEEDRSWRPVSVSILVMYPEWYFNSYNDNNDMTVYFFPQADPVGVEPVALTLPIRKADLKWEPVMLPVDADWSGNDREQIGAWLEFDLRDLVPEEGYTTTDYFVSLGWDRIGYPNVGYSNFEMNCPQNWTDYGDGRYVQNSGQDCSWPMLKIEIETVSEGDCEE